MRQMEQLMVKLAEDMEEVSWPDCTINKQMREIGYEI